MAGEEERELVMVSSYRPLVTDVAVNVDDGDGSASSGGGLDTSDGR